MPKPTPQQKRYYTSHDTLLELLADIAFAPSLDWEDKIAVLSNGTEYWCDGAIWQPYGTGSSSGVGSLDANSPIAGNPADADTPLEIANKIQALEALVTAQSAQITSQAAQITALSAALAQKMDKSVYDIDNNSVVDAAESIDGGYV